MIPPYPYIGYGGVNQKNMAKKKVFERRVNVDTPQGYRSAIALRRHGWVIKEALPSGIVIMTKNN